LGVGRWVVEQVDQRRECCRAVALEPGHVGAGLGGQPVQRHDGGGALGLVGASLAAGVLLGGGLDARPGTSGSGVGGAQPGELDARGARPGSRDLGGCCGLDDEGLLDRCGHGRLRETREPGFEGARVGRPFVGRDVTADLADPADEVGDGRAVLLGGPAELDAAIAQPPLRAVEAPCPEHLLEQCVALLRAGAEECLEPSLREHRHLAELRQGHPDQPGDEVAGLVEAGAEWLPDVLAMVDRVVAVDRPGPVLGDHDASLLAGGAGAALLGADPCRRAVDAEPTTGQGHLEHDARDDVGSGVVGAEPLGDRAVAGDVAVEGEAHCVEDARLPGARRAAQEEQAGVGQRVEVDGDRVGERAEADDLEVVQPHDEPPARPAAARTAVSCSGS
jgi:hypothetical protein